MDNTYRDFVVYLDRQPEKLIFSNPRKKTEPYKKIVVRKIEQEYLIEKYTKTQVFHEKVAFDELGVYIQGIPEDTYRQIDMLETDKTHCILVGKNANIHWNTKEEKKVSTIKPRTQDKQKQYIIPIGTVIEPLVDMGIFTAEGKVVQKMFDKFKQINRFIELLDDEVKKMPTDRTIHIIDFGCGKSYLTFIVYYYFREIRKQDVHIVGLDLKEEVIKNCNRAAEKYGYNKLKFEVGDIHGYKADFDVDIVISLHACDVATDFALFNAVDWNAKLILSVPCCQHELNKQIQSDDLSLLNRYGIVQERFAALLTDAARANLLSSCGYKAQLLEFVDLSHTPKNLLIRAVRTNMPKKVRLAYLEEAKRALDAFGTNQTLYELLKQAGKLPIQESNS